MEYCQAAFLLIGMKLMQLQQSPPAVLSDSDPSDSVW